MRGKWLAFFALILFSVGTMLGVEEQPKWEISLHFSTWSLNMLRGAIENKVSELLEDSLSSRYIEDLREDHPDYYQKRYSHTVAFDSGGGNFGLDVRWFPGGRLGSFSLGFAVEKTSMRIGFSRITTHMDLGSTSEPDETITFDADVQDAHMVIKPLSLHVNFCWEIKPSWRVHPFFTFGFGFFATSFFEKGRFTLSYWGEVDDPDEPLETESGVIDESVREFLEEGEEDGELNLPTVLPIFQLNVGIRARISESIHLLLSAGIWNGFQIRGGLALRI